MSQAAVPGAASATRGVMMNSHELQSEYPEECNRLNQLLVEPLVAAIRLAEEEGAATPTDPVKAAMTIFRLAGSTTETYVLSRQVPSEEDIEFLVNFILSGLGAEPGSAASGRHSASARGARAPGTKRARPAV
jgi:Fic family protein